MISLLIDTSNRPLSIALNRDDALIAEINATVKKTHSGTIMDYVDKLFKIADIDKKKIDRIIVARGPGSYTGVRIGVTAAKTLAFSLGVELYSVSSLFVIAASTGREGIFAPVFDGRRGNVFGAVYQIKEDCYEILVEPQYMSFDALKGKLKSFNSPEVLLDRDEKFSAGAGEFTHTVPRITAVEKYRAALKSEGVHQLVPEYLRVSEAERNWLEKNRL
ncbi:tRNA (adenosine(37)-N6)-threonylcarbamoyltransferase complex dimerization subunit type 1 TsaB [Salinicoccus albus]|uniref:tRNA (adenosine(37)-N6)-threonylcarbamoyltransferase complex dimerization subunit type 1 TsaB n=1 Tax=Salinicoccus albus TaxID=418756 RepID=UPI0003600131|nr:tRNA (adenosine(37)-N6)-threonylcarbamoyltransferase complex dimerization subunit type 1 TsaB [Salinicoccus albus]